MDPAGAELGTDGPATGHPVPGQVQDHSLTTSFIWSSLTILITFRSRFGILMVPKQLRKITGHSLVYATY